MPTKNVYCNQKNDILKLLTQRASGRRLIGLDVGSKTIGVALSDISWTIASPHMTIRRQGTVRDFAALLGMIKSKDVSSMVLGLPLNMNGSEGPRCQSVRQFAANLQRQLKLPFAFWDERLSTVAVTRTLLEADMSRHHRRKVVDKIAAAFILQGALDFLGTETRS